MRKKSFLICLFMAVILGTVSTVSASEFEYVDDELGMEILQDEELLSEVRINDGFENEEKDFEKEGLEFEFFSETDITTVQSDVTNMFTDRNFRKAVQEKLGKSIIWAEDCAKVTELDVSHKGIEDMSGIEYFVALEKLDCSQNALHYLDLSSCRKLRELDCSGNLESYSDSADMYSKGEGNSLSYLNLQNCVSLEVLNCSGSIEDSYGNLEELDLLDCVNLRKLYCANNALTSLEIYSPYLEELDCSRSNIEVLRMVSDSSLRSLNCSSNHIQELLLDSNKLEVLDCNANNLRELDLQKCYKLQKLNCGYNELYALDCSANKNLTDLDCGGNDLTVLNVKNCKKLEELWCSNTQLVELNVSHLSELKILYCNNSHIRKLNLIGCYGLQELECSNNSIADLSLGSCRNLKLFQCENNQIQRLNVSDMNVLSELDCHNNRLVSLEVRDCSAMENINCSENQLQTITITGCPVLIKMECNQNSLKNLQLDVPDIQYLYCQNNQLETLELDKWGNLKELDCANNALLELVLTNCMMLQRIDCSWNKLSILDVSDCRALEYMNCAGNCLQELDVTELTSLFELDCSRNWMNSEENIKGRERINTFLFSPQYTTQTLERPVLDSVKSIGLNHMMFTWKPVNGAEKYHIYRRNVKQEWKEIDTVGSDQTYYVDNTVYPGKIFMYTVCASGTIHGKWQKGQYYKAGVWNKIDMEMPVLISAKATQYNQVKLIWSKVNEGEGYRIYRKTGNSNWKRVAQISNIKTTSYIDKSVKCGSTYTYTIRALARKDEKTYVMSDYNEKGIQVKVQTAAPKLNLIQRIGTSKIKIQWTAVSGASGYRIYRKLASDLGDKWKNVGTVNAKTTAFTDKTAKANKAYRYTVRSYRNVNKKKVWGGYEKKGLFVS